MGKKIFFLFFMFCFCSCFSLKPEITTSEITFYFVPPKEYKKIKIVIGKGENINETIKDITKKVKEVGGNSLVILKIRGSNSFYRYTSFYVREIVGYAILESCPNF